MTVNATARCDVTDGSLAHFYPRKKGLENALVFLARAFSWRRCCGGGLIILICASFIFWVSHDDHTVKLQVPRDFTDDALFVGSVSVYFLLFAATLWLHAFNQRTSIVRLATQIEQQGTDGMPTVFCEGGSPAVVRLTQAINHARHHNTNRLAELLNIQASYAHDLRIPLTRIGIRCASLEDSGLREAINRDVSEMVDLVEESLACARMQCSADEPPRRVDVDELLAGVIANYQDAGCVVELTGRVGDPVMTCPHSLRRVLVNLTDNALRYGADVRLNVRVEAGSIVFAVLDAGPGIPASEIDAVFSPWYQGSHTPRIAGSGLGLAIAHRLTRAMHGELQLKNRPTGGLEARLTLPLVAS